MRNLFSFKAAVILSLSILLGIPTAYLPHAHAVPQSGPNATWSEFGPRQNTISFKVYADTQSMLGDFDAGLIDITDVPDLVNRVDCLANSACDTNNANYYVTNGQAELGEEQIDISHQVSFLGLPLQCGRIPFTCAAGQGSPGFAPQTPTIIFVADTATACDATHFQLLIHLKNFEENLALITDPNEVITATPPFGPASSKSSTTGTYDLGCLFGLPPGYFVSTAVYGDAATPTSHLAGVSIATSSGGTGPLCANNRLCDVDFNVDYNSPSTKEPTVASIHIGRALQHFVDKPNFLKIPVLNGSAVCDDIWGSPSQGIMTPVGDRAAACSVTNAGVPAVEVSCFTNYGATCLSVDSKVKFVDSPVAITPNAPGTWSAPKAVVYDGDSSGTYTAGDTVINGTAPAFGTNLSVDPKIKFVDIPPSTPNTVGVWGSAKTVVYDADGSGTYTVGDTVIEPKGATPALPSGLDECTADLSASVSRPPGFSAIPILSCHPVSLYSLVSSDIHGAPTCATNGLGVQIPTATCFPSQGTLGSVTILAEHGYKGPTDLTAACDQLLLAGFSIVPETATCADVAAGNVVTGVTAHVSNNGQRISYLIRLPGAFPARPRYGQISADELNFLFGTGPPNGGTVCYGTLTPTPGPGATCSVNDSIPHYYSIGQVGADVFRSSSRWNLYTGAQSHAGTADALLYSWHSQFAGSSSSGANCGGPLADSPGDYDLFCDPVVDTQAFAGEFSASFIASFAFFQNTAALGATRGVLAPIFSNVNKYVALNAWNTESQGTHSSLAPGFGTGFEASTPGAFQTLLNMRPSGLVTSGIYQAGGGTQGLIRRSNTGAGTLHQNPFTANTVWEVDLINGIWDTMLAVNPNTGGSNLQLIDWMTKSHSSSFDPGTGRNTQIWNLRNDICWQDSTIGPTGQPCDSPVTADDVCFSLLMQRDGPGRNNIAAQDIVSCTFPDPQTVVVVHNGLSAFQDINIGGVYILPAHIWGTACGWASGIHDSNHEPKTAYASGVGVIGAPCVLSGFDPMALTFNGVPFSTPLPLPNPAIGFPGVSGLMVGSGAYMCKVPTHTGPGPAQGMIGGSCAVNPATGALQGQALDVGFVQVETKFPFYMRCCDNQQGSNLQVLSWADSTKIGKVTIVAASALSFNFERYDSYFIHPLYGLPEGFVDIEEASFMANAFDSGTIAPCLSFSCPGPPNEPTPAAPLLAPDSAIDPFLINFGGGNLAYYQAMGFSGSTGIIQLTIMRGVIAPSSVSARIENPPSGYSGPTAVAGITGVSNTILISFPGLSPPAGSNQWLIAVCIFNAPCTALSAIVATIAVGDFRVSSNWNFAVVLFGGDTSVVQGNNAFNGTSANPLCFFCVAKPVALSCGPLPVNAACFFSENGKIPYFSSILTISTACSGTTGASTPPGTYSVMVSGTDGSLTKTHFFNLTVLPGSGCL